VPVKGKEREERGGRREKERGYKMFVDIKYDIE
jgi:hypothetical protein